MYFRETKAEEASKDVDLEINTVLGGAPLGGGSLNEKGEEGVDDGLGEVKRTLEHRHLQMIGIGSAIGTGLWLGTGYALTTAGPAGLMIGFMLLGLAMLGVMEALGEMASMFPGSGSFPHFAGRFVSFVGAFDGGCVLTETDRSIQLLDFAWVSTTPMVTPSPSQLSSLLAPLS